MNSSHALSLVECEFDRAAAEVKRVERKLAKEFDDLYPRTSINPQKLLQRIENLRAELPHLEREADRLVSEKRSAIATVESLKSTFIALADTAARADVRDDAEGARAVDRLASAAEFSRQHIASIGTVPVDDSQLIGGGQELDMRLALADEDMSAIPASAMALISRADWASIPSVIGNASTYDAVQQLWERLAAAATERGDRHLSMSQLLAMDAITSADDVRLHALGALRKISLFGNAIEVHI
jgi:hypothetical protein